MKILEHTPTRLAIQHKPIGAWILGIVMGGMGFAFIVGALGWHPVVTQLRCDRRPNNFVVCQQQRSTVLGIKSQQTVVDVQSAQVLERRNRNSRSYYIAIANTFEQVEVTNSRNNTATISQIQAFLNNTESTLRIRYSRFDEAYPLLFAGIVFSLAGVWFLTLSITTCTFYKSLQKIVIQQTGLLGKREVEYLFPAFQYAAIEEEKTKNGKVYRLVLWFKDSRKVPLTRDKIANRRSVETVLTEIQAFLK